MKPRSPNVTDRKCYNLADMEEPNLFPTDQGARPSKDAGKEEPPISCFHCGECCKRYQVLLDDGEIERIADYLGMSQKQLKQEHTDPRWPVPDRYLLRHWESGGCTFLVQRGKEALCSIHVVKPNACRDWAPALSRKECGQGLARVWGLSVNAAGDICGADSNKQAFQEFLKLINE